MSESITAEELKDAIEVWAPKFNLIRELWPGASIEESLKLMTVIEDRAGELKEEKKSSMGFSAHVDKKKSKTERKVQANSPFNDGWTKQFYEDKERPHKKTNDGCTKQFYEDEHGLIAGELPEEKSKKNDRIF